MKLRPTFLVFMFFSLLSVPGAGQPLVLPFCNGEFLQYRIAYNWEFVWVNAGTVTFEVDSAGLNNEPVYHFRSSGRSLTAYDWIFRVRDEFQSVASAESLQSRWYERQTSEGNYLANNRLEFLPENGIIISETENSNKPFSRDTLAFNPRVYDLQTAIYLARATDFSSLQPEDKIPLLVIIDGEIYDLMGKYKGIENIENYDGKIYRCHHFTVTLVAGTIFNEGEEASIWVTDDRNKVPILIEAGILVGSVKSYFVKAKNLKYPVEAEIN